MEPSTINISMRKAELELLIRIHRSLYENGERSIYHGKITPISDTMYDRLEAELRQLDPTNSLFRQVGTNDDADFTIRHVIPCLSLDKTKSHDELHKLYDGKRVVISPKFDGLAVSLRYYQGQLVEAATRGNKYYGRNVLEAVLAMSRKQIPDKLPFIGDMTVRGEIFLDKETFKRAVEEAPEDDKPTSIRNLTSGWLACDDKTRTALLSFFCYGLIRNDDLFSFPTYSEEMEYAGKMGFYTYCTSTTYDKLAEQYIRELEHSTAVPAKIDGAVIRIDDNSVCQELGFTDHHPRYGIAFKYKDESATTKISAINLSMSRFGVLTPVAELTPPVTITGSVVSNVSLYNYSSIKMMGIKIGSTVEVIKANDIIPQIIDVSNEGPVTEWVMPETCPFCGRTLQITVSTSGTEKIQCPLETCYGRFEQKMAHWCDSLEIKEFGPYIFKRLVAYGVKDLVGFYNTAGNPAHLMAAVPSMSYDNATKMAARVTSSIGNRTIQQFLVGLGIERFSLKSAEACSKYLTSLSDFIAAARAGKLVSEGLIGSATNKCLMTYLDNYQLDAEALMTVVKPICFTPSALNDSAEGPLVGRVICVTGAFNLGGRPEVEAKLRLNGAKVVSSVTSACNLLIAGKNPHSKLQVAQKRGIEIWNEDNLTNAINPVNDLI